MAVRDVLVLVVTLVLAYKACDTINAWLTEYYTTTPGAPGHALLFAMFIFVASLTTLLYVRCTKSPAPTTPAKVE